MKVYIAGPYTGGDTIVNVRNAVEAGDRIVQAGHNAFVPHLFHFWHFLLPGDYEQWMRLDFEWLESCEVLLRLPGDSGGADREVELARELGIPVFFGFSAEFWAHLKRAPGESVYARFADEVADCMAAHPGATMTMNQGGEFVVSWRQAT